MKKIIVVIVVFGCVLGVYIFGIVLVVEVVSLVISLEMIYWKCFGGDCFVCVVDGDMFWIEGVKI